EDSHAGEHDDAHQLPFDWQVPKGHHFLFVRTMSDDARSSLELKLNFASLAASALIRKRTRFASIRNRIITPRGAEPAMSLTVSTGLLSSFSRIRSSRLDSDWLM